MKHQVNIYYKDSLLFSESFRNLDEAKELIKLRIVKFPISILSLIRRKKIQFNDLQYKDFRFEYEELRIARIEALKENLHYKSHTFWVHNFMRFCPSFKVVEFKKFEKHFYQPYHITETKVGTKIINKFYGYTHAFTLELKR